MSPVNPITLPKTFKPKMNVYNHQNTVTATFEFPGVSKDGIEIDLHSGKLTVSAEIKEPDNQNEEDGYVLRERRFGKHSRTLEIPQIIKEDEVVAFLENGVLTVTFPKVDTGEPKRITVL